METKTPSSDQVAESYVLFANERIPDKYLRLSVVGLLASTAYSLYRIEKGFQLSESQKNDIRALASMLKGKTGREENLAIHEAEEALDVHRHIDANLLAQLDLVTKTGESVLSADSIKGIRTRLMHLSDLLSNMRSVEGDAWDALSVS